MLRVGNITRLDPETVRTTIDDPEAGLWDNTIYAIVFGGFVERIGASKGPLRARCRQTDRYLTNFLRGKCPPQNERELGIWRECFERHGTGMIYARVGPMVTTDFGPYNDYLAIENVLLSTYKRELRLNNSHFR
jgi:hypothetical protein